MNEQRKNKYVYLNPSVSEQKETAEDLLTQINLFIHKHQLKPGDWTLLFKLIKQLNGGKSNLPRKVLRSIQTKFDSIQSRYQR